MNNDQAIQNRLGGGCHWLRANMSRLLQAMTLAAAIVAGGVWFAVTPGSNSLTLDRQYQAADTAYRAQARGQQLAASHQAVREIVTSLPRSAGENPAHTSGHVAYSVENDNAGGNGETGPAETVADPVAIPHRVDERVVMEAEGNFVTDGDPGSRQETTHRYEARVNADRPDTQEQQKVTRMLDLWAPRYADAKASHQLLTSSVGQAKKYSLAYFGSQRERIDGLNASAGNYSRLKNRMDSLLETQESKYQAWARQADAILTRSHELLQEMGNINSAMRFVKDAADYDAMVNVPVTMEAEMQLLVSDLSIFEDNTIALLDAMGNPEPPPAHRAGGNR